MNEIIETLGMTLLWEVISDRVENVQELPKILGEDLKGITGVEIIDSDTFNIKDYNINDYLTLNFEMPFIMMLEVDGVQRYRLQANAIGQCVTSNPNTFEFDINDLTQMNKRELLSHEDLVTINDLDYQDIELDEII